MQNVGNQNGLIVVLEIANQNGNRNVVAAWAENNEIKEVSANCILMANLQQASTSGTNSNKAPVYDSDGSVEDDSNVIHVDSSMDPSGGELEHHSTTIEKTRAFYEALYNNVVTEFDPPKGTMVPRVQLVAPDEGRRKDAGYQNSLWCIKSDFSKHEIENLKLLISFVWKFMGTVHFGNDHVASPEYVPGSDFEAHPEDDDDEDPEEDPVDYPADGGHDGDDEEESSEDDEEDEDDKMDIEADDEDEEKEHPVPADFVVIAPTTANQAPSVEETEPFETDESPATPPSHPAYRTTARISIPAPVPMPAWTDSEVVRLLAISSPLVSPLSLGRTDQRLPYHLERDTLSTTTPDTITTFTHISTSTTF
nr:ribonuclease H-like domain-containing protein [Tanacetum cinerariifolium]